MVHARPASADDSGRQVLLAELHDAQLPRAARHDVVDAELHRLANDLLAQELASAEREGLIRRVAAADARNLEACQADHLGRRRASLPVRPHDDHLRGAAWAAGDGV